MKTLSSVVDFYVTDKL